jgi:hypothetical protein
LEDFLGKLLLAVIAFLLGLLSDVLKRVFQKERRRAAWSVDRTAIVSSPSSLPDEVRAKAPGLPTTNLFKITVSASNEGKIPLTEANLLVVAPPDTEIVHSTTATVPTREVVSGSIEQAKPNELRLKGFNLQKGQGLSLTLYTTGSSDSPPELFWSGGGGDVAWLRGDSNLLLSAHEHVLQVTTVRLRRMFEA